MRRLILLMMVFASLVVPEQARAAELTPRSVGDRDIRLRTDATPIQIGWHSYKDGWTATMPAHLEIPLDGKHQTFTAKVGMPGLSRRGSRSIFEVRVDGRRVLRTAVLREGRRGATIAVDVKGAKKLELLAHRTAQHHRSRSYYRNTPIAVWAEPRLIDKPAAEPDNTSVFADHSVQQKLLFKTKIDGRTDRRPYYLSLPKPLDEMKAEGRRYPMVVFLHGIAEGGDDHLNLFIEAIPLYLEQRPNFVQRHPFIFVCPQAPWQTRFSRDDVRDYVIALIEHLRDTLPVDVDRIYLTGLSDGGIGTWAIARHRPDLFAAIAPVAGRAVDPQTTAEALKQVPAWMVVGELDEGQRTHALLMSKAYEQLGIACELTIVPGMHHVVWDQAYLNPAMYDWLLQWKRGGNREPYTGLRGGQTKADRQALAALFTRAQDLRDNGRPIDAYKLYQQIALRDVDDEDLSKLAQLAMAAMQRDPKIAAQINQAADDTSAARMLQVAMDYQRAGKPDEAKLLYQKIIDTWPLTAAANQAKKAMNDRR